MKKSNALKTKFSPLTIALFVLLTVYVLFLLAVFLWVFLTASKSYFGDYSSFYRAYRKVVGEVPARLNQRRDSK